MIPKPQIRVEFTQSELETTYTAVINYKPKRAYIHKRVVEKLRTALVNSVLRKKK